MSAPESPPLTGNGARLHRASWWPDCYNSSSSSSSRKLPEAARDLTADGTSVDGERDVLRKAVGMDVQSGWQQNTAQLAGASSKRYEAKHLRE